MKNRSKSFSNFKIRKLTLSERNLLSKYKVDDIRQKTQIIIKNREKRLNLKLNFNPKKIKKITIENKANLIINNLEKNNTGFNDNYFNSLMNNKRNKEYFNNLYNNENSNTCLNLNINNQTNINNIANNSEYLNRTKNILFKDIIQKNKSYKNIFNIKKLKNIVNNLNLITNNNKNSLKNLENSKSKLDNEIINNNTFNITFAKKDNINQYKIKPKKKIDFNIKLIQKKINAKKIKNKIIFRAVDAIRQKRNTYNQTYENKKFNDFKIYKTCDNLKLENIENINRSSLLRYSSIMTDLLNKNKKIKIFS